MGKCVLVTGANGQLGKSLQEIVNKNVSEDKFFFTDVDSLDITCRGAIASFVKKNHIDTIVNVAAYTAVEKAEEDVEKAYLLNETAVRNLAEVAVDNNCFLIHISTDYVFDGRGKVPYCECDTPNPVSIYGKSKLAGEEAILHCGCRGAIIRTAWLYSPYGNNFVKTMLRLSNNQPEINVVNDQIGCPTLAADLSQLIMCVIQKQSDLSNLEIYHFSDKGEISWYDFACEIMRLANKSCKVNPISTEDYPAKVERPAYSVFNLSKVEGTLGFCVPSWQQSLANIMPTIIYNFENDIK